ncbi:MAG: 3'-5' exoribonuclease [Prevotella sp.]|nr:3'-5' exoribonuclease [Prevotella sp.]
MPNINIALDIETLSLQPTAAIIAIAAKTFELPGEEIKRFSSREFFCNIDVVSSVMAGLTASDDTLQWWMEQDEEVQKVCFSPDSSVTIKQALRKLKSFVARIRSKAEGIAIWVEGTDFDIPILRNAYFRVLDEKEPWDRSELRDARTVIRLHNKPIPPPPYRICPHNPMDDVKQLIWNITNIYKK